MGGVGDDVVGAGVGRELIAVVLKLISLLLMCPMLMWIFIFRMIMSWVLRFIFMFIGHITQR